MPRGRPAKYTDKIAAEICRRISSGESLRAVTASEGMPNMATVIRWLADERYADFRARYTHARDVQADLLAEEILQIADDGRNDTYIDEDGQRRTDWDVVARSKLRIDARKWYASKVAPKKYGDKLTQEHTGADGGPLQITWLPGDK